MISIFNYIKEYNYDDIVKLFLEQALNDNNWKKIDVSNRIITVFPEPFYSLEGEFKVPDSTLSFKYSGTKEEDSEFYTVSISVYVEGYFVDEESYSWSDALGFYFGAKYYYPLLLTRWFHPIDVLEGMKMFEIEEKEKNENA